MNEVEGTETMLRIFSFYLYQNNLTSNFIKRNLVLVGVQITFSFITPKVLGL